MKKNPAGAPPVAPAVPRDAVPPATVSSVDLLLCLQTYYYATSGATSRCLLYLPRVIFLVSVIMLSLQLFETVDEEMRVSDS